MSELEYLDARRRGQIELVSRRLHDRIVIGVSGEVDLATVGAVERELLVAEECHRLVVLDLSNTSFMDSTGIHMIIAATRRLQQRGGHLVVVQGPPPVRRLLELTGVAEHVELVDDADDVGRAAAASG